MGPGVGIPLVPGTGIQLGTWQQSGSAGSGTMVHCEGMLV